MKLLVTGAWKYTNEQLIFLKSIGNEILFLQNESYKLPNGATEVDGVICNGLFLYHDIRKFRNLRYIQLTSAGFDRVPMEYVKEHNITVHNARGVYSIPMAEFAVSGVLQLYKQSQFFYENQKARKWDKHRGLIDLFGKKVLIVGCGSVGSECAKRFNAFGCDVQGVDLLPYNNEEFREMVAIDYLDEKLTQSDIVVLTLPLTEKNVNLFDGKRFSKMPSGSVLVNIARGKVVDTSALIEALTTKLLGAVLDVFESEPLGEDSPLWHLGNAIITPHNSFVGDGNGDRLWAAIKNNLENYQ